MMKPRIGLFAEQAREDRRAKLGSPLASLAEHIDSMCWRHAPMPPRRVLRVPQVAVCRTDGTDDRDPDAATTLQSGRGRAGVLDRRKFLRSWI